MHPFYMMILQKETPRASVFTPQKVAEITLDYVKANILSGDLSHLSSMLRI